MAMKELEEMLQAVSEELSAVATGDAVVGSPIQLGEVTVYPVSLVSVGLGGGGGDGETAADSGKPEKGTGGGSGGGARACPVAVLVVGADGVKVLPLPQRRGPVERLMDKLPDLVNRVKGACA
jgi:uncharacterized spore protein YtfJ